MGRWMGETSVCRRVLTLERVNEAFRPTCQDTFVPSSHCMVAVSPTRFRVHTQNCRYYLFAVKFLAALKMLTLYQALA